MTIAPALRTLMPLAALLAAGCGQQADAPTKDVAATAAPATLPSAAASAAESMPIPVVTGDIKSDNSLYEFTYRWPVAAGSIAPLRQWLAAEAQRLEAEVARESREDQAGAKENGFPYRPHSLSYDWKVVTDLSAWLSLSTIVGSYTGGAHPNYAYDTLLWDKRAGQRRAPVELFTSAKALSAALRPAFCAELDRQRAKKRGQSGAAGGWQDECIDPLEQTLILGSSNGRAFNRIGMLVAPYNAGPYAEGSYEVTLPVTPAVLALVKPEYQSSFVAVR